jgi:regulator of replication initiation timing
LEDKIEEAYAESRNYKNTIKEISEDNDKLKNENVNLEKYLEKNKRCLTEKESSVKVLYENVKTIDLEIYTIEP